MDLIELIILRTQGIKIARDDEGNIYLTKLSKNNVFIKGFTDPEKYCFSQEVGATEGRLEYDRVKVCLDLGMYKRSLKYKNCRCSAKGT